MPGEIFNPNPTIFSTSKTQRKTEQLSHSLWINDDPHPDADPDDVLQPIDQDEIFGIICFQL